MGAVSPDRLIGRALADPELAREIAQRPVYLLAVGKAAAPMADAWLRRVAPPKDGLVIGTHRGKADLRSLRWRQGGHPIPNEQSVSAGREALDFARSLGEHDCLVVLLSGGASAAMAAPLGALSIADKQATVSALLAAGADITGLNTVRKHLSAIKGGRLAAACAGTTWTLAVSDVVGDDPAVIGSGPTVPDVSTFADAQRVLETLGVASRLPPSVRAVIEAGLRGEVEESVKPGDPRVARAEWRMIGGRREAMAGAKEAAEQLGYRVLIMDEPVVGDARRAGRSHIEQLPNSLSLVGRPACIVSSGETTVKVTGNGIGGRNQEFVLSAATGLTGFPSGVTVASAGTDGIDGPTNAAGAIADDRSIERARAAGLPEAADYFARNDSYHFFAALDDLIVTGPTDTNVGDLQVVLIPE
jgi:hydroxypyruvate reductase